MEHKTLKLFLRQQISDQKPVLQTGVCHSVDLPAIINERSNLFGTLHIVISYLYRSTQVNYWRIPLTCNSHPLNKRNQPQSPSVH